MTEQNTFSISELQQKANNGDAQAQFDLAYCYAKGQGGRCDQSHRYAKDTEVEKNLELALMWLTKSAKQGLVNAQLSLGFYYSDGCIFNNRERLNEKVQKAWRDYPEYAPFSLTAYLYSDNADAELSFIWFTKAAEQDCAEAQYWLARCYFEGRGIELNDRLAFAWFKKAAEQDCALAQLGLAGCYFEVEVLSKTIDAPLNGMKRLRNNTVMKLELGWINKLSCLLT